MFVAQLVELWLKMNPLEDNSADQGGPESFKVPPAEEHVEWYLYLIILLVWI